MASVTELIKILRERTGAGMLDCKKALDANENDLERATDWLREKGIAKAAKKSTRIAAEGLTTIVAKGNDAVIVEVNSETDFVAKNEMFITLVNQIAESLLAGKPANLEAAQEITAGDTTLATLIVNATARIGEKISLRRFQIVTKQDDETFGQYLHMGGKIGVITVLKNSEAEVARDIAMHVAATAPQYISKADIQPEYIEKETHIQMEVVKNDPELSKKPEVALRKIVEGKVNKQLKDVCLLDQPFVKQPDQTVEAYLGQHKASVVTFVRYMVGEGIQKREDNFADEVMSQINK